MVNPILFSFYKPRLGELSHVQKQVLVHLCNKRGCPNREDRSDYPSHIFRKLEEKYKLEKKERTNKEPEEKSEKKDQSPCITTVGRAAVELAKQKLIRKLDIKNSKGRHYYIITIWGLRKCLQEESIGKEPLEYQRSKDAEKIIKLIHEEYELEKTCSFSRALSISPSFIEALSEFNNIWEKPIIIRNKDIIKEMAVSSANIYVIGNSNTLHKRYILEHLPLIFLMKDISKYPQNRELKEAIVKGVIEIRNDKKPISIIKEDCFEHLYIYIPPFGESILACDGQCLRPCL